MPPFDIILSPAIPDGASVTPAAMQAKVFAVINKDGSGEVWIGKTRLRRFKFSQNALKKQSKVLINEQIRARKIYKTIAGKGTIVISKRNKIENEPA